ncbi:MAG TPA: hypothetical protein VJB65_03235, partial [Patescibacteria group bacterium]|nr:hypothetical protein [Patescibacteria group bacterium]
MKNSFKGWVQFLCIGLMFFSVSFVANASTIDDPYITSVSVTDRTETATSATNVTYEISFVTSHAISTGEYIHISSRPTACSEQTYDNCLMNFDSVTITGISGDVTYGAYGYLSFVTSANFAAGTHTITLQHVKHPIVAGSQRFLVSTSAHGMQPSSNDDTYGTPSDPVVIGSPLVTGAVTDASNNPVSSGWAQVYKEDWSLSAGFGIDEWGAYAVANPGFVNGDIVHISVYPDASTGLFTTHDSFTYNGTTATKDIVLQEATKTITGTVTYEDTGDPVTSASVNVNGGSTWAGTNPDENGLYSMKITGGDYEVCLGDQWNENGRVAKDWYLQGDGQCQHVLFASDTSEEIETLNFEVKRADAHVVGVIKNPDGSYPENGGWVSFSTKDGMWFGSDVNSETGEFDVALVGGTSEITATSLSARAVGSTTYQVQYSAHSQDEHTFWDESTVTVNADETKNLGTIILSERDVVYTATVVDTDGNPVPNIHVNAWQEQGGWTDATTNDSGVASLYLYAGSWFIRPSIWGDVASEYIYAGMDEKVTFASGDTGNGTFILTRTTLTVTANARAEDGSLAAVNGWANCWSNDGYGFGGQI